MTDASSTTVASLPLEGVRVVDLTMVWAGPFATKLLADMGAEVIKIESPRHMDPLRMATIEIFMQGRANWEDKPYNRSSYFNEYSRNKKGLALALDTDRGKEILLELIARSDILIENFRPDAMDKLGLTRDVIEAANPNIVFVSMPAYGSEGPDSGLVGYGPSIEEMTGLANLNGYQDGPPMKTGISYGDPMAGVLAAAAACLGLLDRQQHGGQHIEVAQRDGLIGVVGDSIINWQLTGVTPERLGNRHEFHAPQGCYECKPFEHDEGRPLDIYHSAGQGERATDRWVTLSVESDEQWPALCELIGRDDLAADPSLATAEGRRARHDEIDDAIAAWTQGITDYDAADALQALGIAASPVISMTTLPLDPHLAARHFIESVEHPQIGATRVSGTNWRHAGPWQPSIRRSAPLFGQDNRDVLSSLLGLSDEEISALEQQGVTADEPAH
jgi:crotonobetainyl-CoA:carnitine CoA-transferase CaiB-like acyl-CoA transferase